MCSHPLAPNHPWTPGSTIPTQKGFRQERDTSNAISKTTGYQATKTSQHSCAQLSTHHRGREILPAGGWFRENGAEESPTMELEFPFPAHLHLLQQTHIALKKHPAEAVLSQLSLHSCWFYHVMTENRLFHHPVNQEQKEFLVFCIMTQK